MTTKQDANCFLNAIEKMVQQLSEYEEWEASDIDYLHHADVELLKLLAILQKRSAAKR